MNDEHKETSGDCSEPDDSGPDCTQVDSDFESPPFSDKLDASPIDVVKWKVAHTGSIIGSGIEASTISGFKLGCSKW
jgi:hypothetical protein